MRLKKPFKGRSKLDGVETLSSEPSSPKMFVDPKDLDPLQMQPGDEDRNTASTEDGNGLDLSRVNTDPVNDRKPFHVQPLQLNNEKKLNYPWSEAQSGIGLDLAGKDSELHRKAVSTTQESLEALVLSGRPTLYTSQQGLKQGPINPSQPPKARGNGISPQSSWPKDQNKIQDSMSSQLTRVPLVRNDSSYTVKTVAEVMTGPDMPGHIFTHGSAEVDSKTKNASVRVIEDVSAVSYPSGPRQTNPTHGPAMVHQAAMISTSSKTRDTTIIVTDTVCDTCNGLESNVRKQSMALKDLEKVIEELEGQNKELKRQIQEKGATETSLKHIEEHYLAQIAELEQSNEWLRNKVSEQALPTGRQAIPGVGLLPDSDITERWRKLSWNMRQHVSSNVVMPSKYPVYGESRLAVLNKITPTYTLFLRSKNDRIDLAQAVIWDYLANYVFASRTCSSWGYGSGKFSDQLKPMTDSVSAGHRQDRNFHLWRSQTAALLASYAKPDDVQSHARKLVEDIEKDLKHLLQNWGSCLRKQLFGLVMDAIQLDVELSQQKSWWFCEYPGVSDRRHRYDIEFQGGLMKAVNGNIDEGATHVTLMVSPALMKAGNSAGDNYNTIEVIVECSVHRGNPRMPVGKATPATSQALVSVRHDPMAYQNALRDKRKAQSEAESQTLGSKILKSMGI
ncbi:uncharacterized protein JN550_004619 [Neoarthrinium moseri]|uniref:uncharacterized protein n=1 Tax=Neoarthrinium moseri TaxID=1658444 RepID=UPI001FDD9FF7|nr:uncharacterized protein JN550_004619 [Neoarthrinium moseri]KAI1871174.1 hypothetical protein JN550_004619 [Neoarthrinium moseri]